MFARILPHPFPTRFLACLACLASLLATSGANAGLVIDSFEQGGYSFQDPPGFDFICQGTIGPFHAAAERRCTNLTPYQDGLITCTLQQGLQVDDATVITMSPPGGEYKVWWHRDDNVGMNLRKDGADRILLRLHQAPANTLLSIRITDTDYNGDVSTVTLTGPGEYEILLADYTNVNTYSALRITLTLMMWGEGVFELADVRTVRPDTFLYGWDMVWEEYQYPIPSPPFEWAIYDPFGAPDEALHQVQMSFRDVLSEGGNGSVVPVMMTGGADGPVGQAQLWWNPTEPFNTPRFRMLVEYPAGVQSAPSLTAMLPSVMVAENSFALQVPLVHTDDRGDVIGNSLQDLVFAPGFGQEIRFTDVQVEASSFGRGGGEAAGFIVSFTVETETEPEIGMPLWEITAAQDFAPGVTAATGVQVGSSDGPRGAGNTIQALPSITRSATKLQFARPTHGRGRVDVYDVTGRIVRTVNVPAGSTSAAWDGRTASGAPASAGVYFARLTEEEASAMARVVLVR